MTITIQRNGCGAQTPGADHFRLARRSREILRRAQHLTTRWITSPSTETEVCPLTTVPTARSSSGSWSTSTMRALISTRVTPRRTSLCAVCVSMPDRTCSPTATLENLKAHHRIQRAVLSRKALGVDDLPLGDQRTRRCPSHGFRQRPRPEEMKAYDHLHLRPVRDGAGTRSGSSPPRSGPPDNDKYAFRCFLLRLRLHRHRSTNSAAQNPPAQPGRQLRFQKRSTRRRWQTMRLISSKEALTSSSVSGYPKGTRVELRPHGRSHRLRPSARKGTVRGCGRCGQHPGSLG